MDFNVRVYRGAVVYFLLVVRKEIIFKNSCRLWFKKNFISYKK